jgi:hypothetical protein
LPIDRYRNADHAAGVGIFRKHRRAIGWLAIVAVLGNVFFFFAPAKAAHGADDILGPPLICTPDGLQGAAHEGDIPKPGHPSGSHCPSCTLVKSFVFALASVPPAFLPPAQNVLLVRWSPTSDAVSQLRLGGIGSRAPPAFA